MTNLQLNLFSFDESDVILKGWQITLKLIYFSLIELNVFNDMTNKLS